jgi:pantoate--beta-alanine ligase
VEPEYFEIVNPDTLSVPEALDGELLVAVAARVGRARLIDNTTVRAPARVASGSHALKPRETPCSA